MLFYDIVQIIHWELSIEPPYHVYITKLDDSQQFFRPSLLVALPWVGAIDEPLALCNVVNVV